MTGANAEAEFERGVRQAMTWLRADYPYGEGPDWREHGAEWIADRLAEHTTADRVLCWCHIIAPCAACEAES